MRHENNDVTLIPLQGALCSVGNVRIHEPTRLNQGAIVRLGRNHVFRFNHPREAAKLREELKGVSIYFILVYSFLKSNLLMCQFERYCRVPEGWGLQQTASPPSRDETQFVNS